MSIPDFQSIMLPLLKLTSDSQEHQFREAIDLLTEAFGLSAQEMKELLPSGTQAVFVSRVSWARIYLAKAGLLESTKRGYFKITERGLEALRLNPSRIDINFLRQYPEFVEFLRPSKPDANKIATIDIEKTSQTPMEALEDAYFRMRQDLAQEVISRIKTCSPSFFERLVVELLVKMGYGGSMGDAGQVIGKSGDGGIDGTIKEDPLGLDVIYVQAKRWEGNVGSPEIQRFVGALQGQRAKKGVFITTSNFSNAALDYVSKVDTRIVLIDGERLAQLMIDHDVGVSRAVSYEIKRIDSDYFTDE